MVQTVLLFPFLFTALPGRGPSILPASLICDLLWLINVSRSDIDHFQDESHDTRVRRQARTRFLTGRQLGKGGNTGLGVLEDICFQFLALPLTI